MFRASGLSVRIGRRFLLQPTDLSVHSGEWKAIVGPNGAGKSTMMKAIAGLMPREGELYWEQTNVADDLVGFRRNVGILLHERALYRGLTAYENLHLAATLWHVSDKKKAIDRWLDIVGLTAFADEKVGHFSQGMTQRLALAKTLLVRPKMLLLDEPLASIDGTGERMMTSLFQRIKADGIAALWVTHRYEKAWPVVDEVIELNRGRVVGRTLTKDVPVDEWVPVGIHDGDEGVDVFR